MKKKPVFLRLHPGDAFHPEQMYSDMNALIDWVEDALGEVAPVRPDPPAPKVDLAQRQQDLEIAKQAAETALAALNAYQTSGRVLTEAEQTLAWALRTLRVETS